MIDDKTLTPSSYNLHALINPSRNSGPNRGYDVSRPIRKKVCIERLVQKRAWRCKAELFRTTRLQIWPEKSLREFAEQISIWETSLRPTTPNLQSACLFPLQLPPGFPHLLREPCHLYGFSSSSENPPSVP